MFVCLLLCHRRHLGQQALGQFLLRSTHLRMVVGLGLGQQLLKAFLSGSQLGLVLLPLLKERLQGQGETGIEVQESGVGGLKKELSAADSRCSRSACGVEASRTVRDGWV